MLRVYLSFVTWILPTVTSVVQRLKGTSSVRSDLILPFHLQLIKARWDLLGHARQCRTVALFGCGKYTKWLDMAIGVNHKGPKVVALLDDTPPHGVTFFGVEPSPASDFDATTVDAVVLSTDCAQARMTKRCRELYGYSVPLVDLYEGLPPGPYEKE